MEINFNFLKQWRLIFKISVNRNGKKLTVSRKKAKILTVSRKRHYPIETLIHGWC